MKKKSSKTPLLPPPLCIDLDGTLIFTDVTWQLVGKFLLTFPQKIFHLLGWLMEGRAHLKAQLASSVELDVSALPYNKSLIAYIKSYPSSDVYLATAADQKIANKVAAHLGIFKGTFGSDGHTNLRAQAKAHKLVEIFGERGFVYAGNSKDDLHVWQHAIEAIPVNTSRETEEKLTHMKVKITRLRKEN